MWRPGATCRCDFRTAFCWLMLWRSCRSGMHLGVQNGDPSVENVHPLLSRTNSDSATNDSTTYLVGFSNVFHPLEVESMCLGMKWGHGTTCPRKMALDSGQAVEKTLEIRFHNSMLHQGWFRKWWIYGLYIWWNHLTKWCELFTKCPYVPRHLGRFLQHPGLRTNSVCAGPKRWVAWNSYKSADWFLLDI